MQNSRNPSEERNKEAEGNGDLERILQLFDSKLYNRAALELKSLFTEDKEAHIGPIRSRYQSYASRGLYEEALAIGLVIFAEEKNNGALANQLGNFARKLGDNQQAISLYEHALKAAHCPEYVPYNLGATLAGTSYFDREAMRAGNFYDSKTQFVLPYYRRFVSPKSIKPDPNFLESINEEAGKLKTLKGKELLEELDQKLGEVNPESQLHKELGQKMKKISAGANELKEEDVMEYFRKQLEAHAKAEKSADWLHFNQALFLISNGKFVLAYRSLTKITKPADFRYFKLLHVICMNQMGKIEDAFKIISQLLSRDRFDRLLNFNMGLIYRKMGRKVMAAKYLIYGFHLTQLSDGLLERDNIIEKAHEEFSKHNWNNALNIYMMLIDEKVIDESVFYNYAQILIKMDDHVKANTYLNQIIPLNGKFLKLAEIQINACFTDFVNKGDQVFLAKKYRNAIDLYSLALIYKTTPEVLKKILDCYEFFKLTESDSLARDKLREKLKTLLEEEEVQKEREQHDQKQSAFDKERTELIEMGRLNIMQKKYYNAIDPLEKAFRMKPERQVFVQLASLYKGLKKNDKLVDLVMRYKNFQEREKKMSKYRAAEGSP